VARSFSGDKAQLIPLLRSAMHHRGFALLDVISPCVTFNDHEGSTRSYAFTREHYEEAVHADFVAPAEPIEIDYAPGSAEAVTLADGSHLLLRKVEADYEPTDRSRALQQIQRHLAQGEHLTGLLYLDSAQPDMHGLNGTPRRALNQLRYEDLDPGAPALAKLLARYR
jgi:2-oxoglutarate ferredoxin oxidoreductase subunit beta